MGEVSRRLQALMGQRGSVLLILSLIIFVFLSASVLMASTKLMEARHAEQPVDSHQSRRQHDDHRDRLCSEWRSRLLGYPLVNGTIILGGSGQFSGTPAVNYSTSQSWSLLGAAW